MPAQLDQSEVPGPSGDVQAGPSEEASPRGRRGFGLLLLVAATLVLSVMSVLVRVAKNVEGLTTYSVTLLRFVVGAAAILAISRGTGTKLHTGNLGLLAVRGSLGAVAVTIYFYSITHIGLAKGTILFGTFPLWAAVLAIIFLRERLRLGLAAAMLAAFGGLYLIVVPTGGLSGISPRDVLAVVGGVCGGGAIVAIRRLRATESSLVIFLSQCLFGMAIVTWPAVAEPPPLEPVAWMLLLAIGIIAAVGQLMLTSAYKYVSVSEAAPLNMLTPVWNGLMGVVVLHESVTGRGLLGALIVLGACTYATWLGRGPAHPTQAAPG